MAKTQFMQGASGMKKIHIAFALSAVLLVLAGCGSARYKWMRPGKSDYEMENQSSRCYYDVRMNKMRLEEREQVVQYCMQANGYRWRPVY